MQVVNTSNIFQRIVFARLSRSNPLRCSVLQCPVSQLCSWEARSKQTCVKNLRGVCSLVGILPDEKHGEGEKSEQGDCIGGEEAWSALT